MGGDAWYIDLACSAAGVGLMIISSGFFNPFKEAVACVHAIDLQFEFLRFESLGFP
jgi:hypothetical protein